MISHSRLRNEWKITPNTSQNWVVYTCRLELQSPIWIVYDGHPSVKLGTVCVQRISSVKAQSCHQNMYVKKVSISSTKNSIKHPKKGTVQALKFKLYVEQQ